MASTAALEPEGGNRPDDAAARRSDTLLPGVAQGRGPAQGRLRTRTLITLRWLAIAGQTVAVLATAFILRYPIALGECLSLIALSAWFNLAMALSPIGRRTAQPWEAAGQLAFDVVQLGGLLFFTGGVVNPFSLLLIAPVTLGAATLPARQAVGVGGLALLITLGVGVWALPMPWAPGESLELPAIYRVACGLAIMAGICFTGGYAFQAANEAARMELALNVTETVLAREQRLSALGALAAAAAHELGTPLATIAIVAKEMAREAPEGPMRDDAWLLVAQAQRCRDILRRLAETPDTGDVVHERMSLLQFVREVVEPYADAAAVQVEAVVTGPPGLPAPLLWRRPEILHAMTSIVENAFDFARGEILVSARFDASSIAVEVRDDGPGFSPEVLARLGEPYVTSRPGAEGSRTGHIGMGLGFFIAKTLLERTGAVVSFRNGRRGGAIVTARWLRERIEAPPAL
ncbi:MAG: ActS/PrrB/RegB family redox-sensitive histidine kinase [Proteobacteria bacterium]|nr:ActS/PrrB/RegB family redox-sensitive histidine kinase [Pseudomonadota bacterium]